MAHDPKDILNPNLLYEDKIQSPRLKDIFHEIDLVNALKTADHLQNVSSQSSQLIAEHSLRLASNRFIGFYVPLDGYIPLPEPYNAESIIVNQDRVTVEHLTVNILRGCTVKININDQENQCRLTVVLACINVSADTTYSKLGNDEIFELYKQSLLNVNKVISAYKLTPLRHNHDLGYVTVENRDSDVQTILFEFGNKPIIDQKTFQMQSNGFASIVHSRTMEKRELDYFRTTHSALSSGMSEAYDIVQNIIAAVDARCNGDFERAVILADKFGELFLRFAYFHLLLKDRSPEDAFNLTNDIRNMKSLVNKTAKLIGITAKEFREKIHNDAFENGCRNIRNTLNHNFLRYEVTGEMATSSIKESITMVCAFCEALEGEDARTSAALNIFRNTHWLIDAHKAGDKKQGN